MIKRLFLFLLLFAAAPAAYAVPNPTAVQCASDDSTSATVTVDGAGNPGVDTWVAPTVGNCLEAVVSVRNANIDGTGDAACPTGFTMIDSFETASGSGVNFAKCVKVAGAGDNSISVTWGQDLGDMALGVCELPSTDRSCTVTEATNKDTSTWNTSGTSIGSGAATNTTADALYVYTCSTDDDNDWSVTPSFDRGTVQRGFGFGGGLPGTVIVTELVSTTASRTLGVTTTDTGGPGFCSVSIYASTGGGGGPALSLDDATPDIGTTPRATAASAPGSTLTTATLAIGGNTDTTSCESGATTLICDIALDYSKFEATGDFNNLRLATAGTVKVSDGTNETATTAITIDVPAADSAGQMTCDPTAGGVGTCPGDSVFQYFAEDYATSDDYLFNVVTGGACTISSAGVPVCPPASLPVSAELRGFDVAPTGVWGTLVELNFTSGCNDGVVRSPVYDPVKEVVRATICL